jgi:hypothetical protein
MARQRRLADVQSIYQFTHAKFAVSQCCQNANTSRVAERPRNSNKFFHRIDISRFADISTAKFDYSCRVKRSRVTGFRARANHQSEPRGPSFKAIRRHGEHIAVIRCCRIGCASRRLPLKSKLDGRKSYAAARSAERTRTGISFEPEGFFIDRQVRRRLQKPGVASLKDPMIFRKIAASTYRRGSDIY